jgi:hypothetical protein
MLEAWRQNPKTKILVDQASDLSSEVNRESMRSLKKSTKFAGFIECGEGEFIKTFLLAGQAPDGQEIH